jgi:hypothetical protein|tara:strand:+ start:289 stop:585 length:297 start_codon:yes stop_codon:yes gene_type:complete
VNTIKKFNFLLTFIFIFSSQGLAFTPEYEKKIYIGCYGNSKQYLGADRAKKYCLCSVNKLSKKFSNEQIDLIFQKKPKEIMKATEFAAIHCENEQKKL